MGPDPAAAPPSPFFSPAVLPATLVATCIPATLSLSSSRRSLVLDSHSLTRLDGSLVSLLSSSFPSPRRSAAGCYPIYDHHLLHFPFSFGVAIHPRHTYLPTYTGALSVHTLSFSRPPFLEALFLLGDKCKTKTYLPYSLCKYAGTATQGGPEFFLRFRSRFPRHGSGSPPSRLARSRLLYHLRHPPHDHTYTAFGEWIRGGGCRTAATGTTATGCFTFPR